MDESYEKLWKYFIQSLSSDTWDWRASEQELAISLLERFDTWLKEREAHDNPNQA